MESMTVAVGARTVGVQATLRVPDAAVSWPAGAFLEMVTALLPRLTCGETAADQGVHPCGPSHDRSLRSPGEECRQEEVGSGTVQLPVVAGFVPLPPHLPRTGRQGGCSATPDQAVGVEATGACRRVVGRESGTTSSLLRLLGPARRTWAAGADDGSRGLGLEAQLQLPWSRAKVDSCPDEGRALPAATEAGGKVTVTGPVDAGQESALAAVEGRNSLLWRARAHRRRSHLNGFAPDLGQDLVKGGELPLSAVPSLKVPSREQAEGAPRPAPVPGTAAEQPRVPGGDQVAVGRGPTGLAAGLRNDPGPAGRREVVGHSDRLSRQPASVPPPATGSLEEPPPAPEPFQGGPRWPATEGDQAVVAEAGHREVDSPLWTPSARPVDCSRQADPFLTGQISEGVRVSPQRDVQPAADTRTAPSEPASQPAVRRALLIREGEGTTLRIRLDPRDTGVTRVEVKVEDGRVSAELGVVSPVVQQWLEAELVHLRQVLWRQGIELATLTVWAEGSSPQGSPGNPTGAAVPWRAALQPEAGEDPVSMPGPDGRRLLDVWV